MKIIRELCPACPQDLVVELDNGLRLNFYYRHGVARLYDEGGVEMLTSREYVGKVDPRADGILPLDEVEDLVKSMYISTIT